MRQDTSSREIKLPPCGIFVGTGVYPMSADYLLCTLYGHLSWAPQTSTPDEMLDKVLQDNQGNLVQLWGYPRGDSPATLDRWFYALDEIGVHVPEPDWDHGRHLRPADCRELADHADRRGAGVLRFLRAATARGLYTMLIYVDAEPAWARRFGEVGEYYLGYDFGERHSPGLGGAARGVRPEDVTLQMLADDLVARARQHIDERHAAGWGNVMATSSCFHVDYEILAGADIPVIEDFAFCHLNLASGLSRGLCRQHGLALWGSHLAHEHYSWIPLSHGRKFDLLRAAMCQKYLAGSKMIINESGNWFVEASLCEDSPKHDLLRVDVPHERLRDEPHRYAAFVAEARKHYHKIDYNAPSCRRYRQTVSDFYDFVQAHPAPEGQPESTVALAKGNLDLCGHRFMPNAAIAGAYDLADADPRWFEGPPERGWEIARRVFYPLPAVLGDRPNHFLSGSPHGMVDVVSFARDRISPEFLGAHYKALLFCGWNTASQRQYDILRQYVHGGGRLFVAIPHLSTNIRRDYSSYTVDELVRGGDWTDLCGVRVKGPGRRIYWATAPRGRSELGFTFPRRFGILTTRMGDVEITDPAAEALAVDDERGEPLLLRRRCGEGEVFFLNSWAYPGALDVDDGPGATLGSAGLIGAVYRHLARLSRGHVWITDDRDEPAVECDYVTFSYFPRAGTICLFNVDFDRPHRFFLHHFGALEAVELAPSEFRMIETRRAAGDV